MTLEQEVRRALVEISQELHGQGYLAACDGNLSYRLSDERILITPTARPKSRIREDEIAVIDIQGRTVTGAPSSESLMHLEVFRACPSARAVIHAHPPCAIAWSVAKPFLKELPGSSLSEVILAVGRIPFVPYARPGTQDMGKNLRPFLTEGLKAMILRNHGALAWGETLEEALNGMERIEHSAKVLMYAQNISGLNELPFEEVRALKQKRREIGNRSL